MVAKNLALATFTGTGRTQSRSMGDRVKDVYNVKDYGAKGDFIADDTVAIEACFADSVSDGTSSNGGTIFFPPGGYKLMQGRGINISIPGIRIVGSGPGPTFITGNIPNGFVFYQNDGAQAGGCSEIAHLSLSNTSINIGSGALMLNDSSCHVHNVGFSGQCLVMMPFNIYDAVFERCGGVPQAHPTDGFIGTLGIAGYAPHIIAFRSTGPFDTCFQLWGSNTSTLIGNGIENSQVACLLGMATGWAPNCTTAGNILTVGGPVPTQEPLIFSGMQVYGTGLVNKPWRVEPSDFNQQGTWIIGDVNNEPGVLTGSGGAGTYRLSRTPPADITTPVPIWTRFNRSIGGVTIAGFQTEACFIGLYCNNVGTSQISSFGGNSAVGENTDKFGDEGYLPHSGIYIKSAGICTFTGCGGSNNTTNGSIYMEPGAGVNGTTFVSCTGVTNVTNSVTASIEGTVLVVSTLISGGGIGIGLPVQGAGVTAGTVITGSRASSAPTDVVTITIASPAVFTRTAHGLVAGNKVTLYSDGALPSPFAIGATYFVIATGLTANTFRLSTTLGGAAINTSGTQAGPHYVLRYDGSTGLSGYNNAGTYRVNNSQTVASETMTLPFGPDWQLPTNPDSLTGVQFINCSTSGTVTGLKHTVTFASLPGEAGASVYVALLEGIEYNITDGQKSGGGPALFADIVVGGGTQHIKVRYDGTNWRRSG